uniref:Leucine rich adaptor protein 1 n=1 Tax=Callorhinchus milii TaxID=7868 RepID=A0A4W3HZ16_CALMI
MCAEMEANTRGDALPELRDLETKVGRRTADGLLRWLREDSGADTRVPQTQGLAEKIRILRLEMAYLRAIDIKIMHQLMAVNEGIEAVKWILEEKGTLASRCSSLTSSMYSLVESQETSRRGSWNSLQDPNDKLDGISIGSFLDTLADDMDEYCQPTVDPVSSLPSAHGGSSYDKVDTEKHTGETHCQPSATANGILGKQGNGVAERGVEAQFPHEDKPCKDVGKLKVQRNGKVDYDSCKLNKVHIEYDAHWHWVQSQDDVTFL